MELLRLHGMKLLILYTVVRRWADALDRWPGGEHHPDAARGPVRGRRPEAV